MLLWKVNIQMLRSFLSMVSIQVLILQNAMGIQILPLRACKEITWLILRLDLGQEGTAVKMIYYPQNFCRVRGGCLGLRVRV